LVEIATAGLVIFSVLFLTVRPTGNLMISTLGRVLTVLMTMFSVAFMAFAISRWATIPDWSAEGRELGEYRLSRTEGETPSWTAVTRRTEDPVATSTNISEVLEKMYQHGTQVALEQAKEYNDEAPYLEQDIEAAKTSIAADEIGVQNLVDQLVAQLEQMEEQVAMLTTQAEQNKAQAQKLQQERERRRSDVFRLHEELIQIRTDSFRAEQLQTHLVDMINRLQGSVIKLQTRQQQLQESLQ